MSIMFRCGVLTIYGIHGFKLTAFNATIISNVFCILVYTSSSLISYMMRS